MSTLTDAFSANCLLVRFQVTALSVSRADDSAARAAEAAGSAATGAVRAVKNILAGADNAYKAVKAAQAAAYSTNVRLTLPWEDKGPRLLPTAVFMQHVQAMAKAEAEFRAALDMFERSWDADVAKAKAALGAYAPTDYPSAAEARAAFTMKVVHMPFAPSGLLKKIPGVGEALAEAYEEHAAKAVGDTLAALIERATEALSRLAGDRVFESAVEEAGAVSEIFRAMEFANPRFAEIADELAGIAGRGRKSLKDMEPEGREAMCSALAQKMRRLAPG